MSYLNGKDVFPAELLREIQRYIRGASVYIPGNENKPVKRRSDRAILERNAEILRRYEDGQSVRSLSGEYYLSTQAVYKIIAKGRKEALKERTL